MIGDYLLAVPGLYESVYILDPYFPSGGWNDLLTGFKIKSESQNPQFKTIYSPEDDIIPLYIRSGKIVPMQLKPKILSTFDLDNTFELIISL